MPMNVRLDVAKAYLAFSVTSLKTAEELANEAKFEDLLMTLKPGIVQRLSLIKPAAYRPASAFLAAWCISGDLDLQQCL